MTLIQIVNMNERIKQLAEQCGFRSDPDIYDRNQSFDIPKFAELIVRECANVAWYHTPDTEELEYSHLIEEEILKHFGVEE